jgi:hypothetical protein
MSAPMKRPHTKSRPLRIVLRAVGPSDQLAAACAALQPLGFTIIPAPKAEGIPDPCADFVAQTIPVTLEMLPNAARVPVQAVLPSPPEAARPGRMLVGARSKEGLTQRQLAALTGLPQRHISEMESGKRPIGKATAKLFGKALKIDYRLLL